MSDQDDFDTGPADPSAPTVPAAAETPPAKKPATPAAEPADPDPEPPPAAARAGRPSEAVLQAARDKRNKELRDAANARRRPQTVSKGKRPEDFTRSGKPSSKAMIERARTILSR